MSVDNKDFRRRNSMPALGTAPHEHELSIGIIEFEMIAVQTIEDGKKFLKDLKTFNPTKINLNALVAESRWKSKKISQKIKEKTKGLEMSPITNKYVNIVIKFEDSLLKLHEAIAKQLGSCFNDLSLQELQIEKIKIDSMKQHYEILLDFIEKSSLPTDVTQNLKIKTNKALKRFKTLGPNLEITAEDKKMSGFDVPSDQGKNNKSLPLSNIKETENYAANSQRFSYSNKSCSSASANSLTSSMTSEINDSTKYTSSN